ncbi:glycosyl transferase family 2 [Thalassoporum mexicanum PCC 7367]|uniref:glycosyltransferase family 2 protein n=1 Tax=Thalassoporum mexicanum TaxID=3457544 RepID=UPI00029FA1DA|nr:glycosyltransferase [Pseudanabaena sp. PCC 7367]AFY71824.1 glycosyl transferase family 2 [Pseudanabaena sp. PCC 7367]
MTNSPLVSICIPTYNAAEFIAETLNSAIAQTYSNFEIIISDDSSSDETAAIVASCQEQLGDQRDRLRWLSHDRYGVVGNWNFCISQAQGKYIKFLFQDDLLRPDCLTQMVALAEQDEQIGLVFAPRHVICTDQASFDPLYINITEAWSKLEPIQSGLDLLSDPKLLTPPFNKIGEPTAVLIRTEVFEQVGLFDINLVQVVDLDMWLRIMTQFKIGFIDQVLSDFRVHQHQQSNQNEHSGQSWIDDWRLQFKMLGDRAYANLPESVKQQLIQACVDRITTTYENMEGTRSQLSKTNHQVAELAEKVKDLSLQVQYYGAQAKAAFTEIDKMQAAFQATKNQLSNTQAELEESNSALWETKGNLERTQAELTQSRNTIAAMESSKFWKLRNKWLDLKRSLGLPATD